jgi:hypothetical protein
VLAGWLAGWLPAGWTPGCWLAVVEKHGRKHGRKHDHQILDMVQDMVEHMVPAQSCSLIDFLQEITVSWIVLHETAVSSIFSYIAHEITIP